MWLQKGLPFHAFYTCQIQSNNNANKILSDLLVNLNINPISVHGLRHTHASVLLYEGVSVYYVSRRLGHGDIETTLNTYSHVVKELEERDQTKTSDVFEKMLDSDSEETD